LGKSTEGLKLKAIVETDRWSCRRTKVAALTKATGERREKRRAMQRHREPKIKLNYANAELGKMQQELKRQRRN
jgi:hypothetical protein